MAEKRTQPQPAACAVLYSTRYALEGCMTAADGFRSEVPSSPHRTAARGPLRSTVSRLSAKPGGGERGRARNMAPNRNIAWQGQ